jgi:aspartate aminotransferase/aminotransferase
MTGWRLGYGVASEPIAVLMAKLAEPLVSCASTISQKAAEAALLLPDAEIAAVRDSYRQRRDLVVDALAPEGLLASRPLGAFYALVDLRGCDVPADELAMRLLEEERVAVAPGSTFGPSTEGMVRISLANGADQLGEGCRRIARFAERHRAQRPH